MDIIGILHRFMELDERNILITDENGGILYKSKCSDYPSESVINKIRNIPENIDEQEIFDKEKDYYYNVKRIIIEDEGRKYLCYHITDVKDYALLIQEVSSYTKNIANMVRFQSHIMKNLSMSYDTFLPVLANYCGSDEVVMFIKKDGAITRSSYAKELVRVSANQSEEYERYFAIKRGEVSGNFTCILNCPVQGHTCVVLVKTPPEGNDSNPMDISVYNVINLFIENCILREKIVYESEHDKLTGLYNKGKYMAMKNASFGSPRSIAICNFDVNNLKHINDTYGHEYGDALIIKAAKSIASVAYGNVYGFRMGGDEYAMIATDITPEAVEDLRTRWKNALDRLNEEDTSLFCSMACGIAFAEGEFDYDELYQKADDLMYENKKELKSQNITSRLNIEI